MARVTQHKARQIIVVPGVMLEDGLHIEEVSMFDSNGEPLTLSGYTRSVFQHPTLPLASGATETSVLSVHPGWRAFQVETNRPARVRIYATEAQRLADLERKIGVDPTGNHGLLFELVSTPEQLTYILSPTVDFMSADGSPDYYIAVTNLDETDGAVSVEFHYVRTE